MYCAAAVMESIDPVHDGTDMIAGDGMEKLRFTESVVALRAEDAGELLTLQRVAYV